MPVDSFEDFAIRLLETTDIPFEDLIYFLKIEPIKLSLSIPDV
jgi:hypothetical protein